MMQIMTTGSERYYIMTNEEVIKMNQIIENLAKMQLIIDVIVLNIEDMDRWNQGQQAQKKITEAIEIFERITY